MQTCKEVEIEVTVEGGEIMLMRAGRLGIPLLGWSKKAWRRAVKNQINDASIASIYRRVNKKNEEANR